jgi:hypothetical protein
LHSATIGIAALAIGSANGGRNLPQATPLADRIFFSLAGLWFLVLTIVGFSQSFYFRTLAEPLPAHQTLHGVVYSAWVALFFAQALLISTHRVRWHIALGTASIPLLALMIPVGFHVVLVKTAAGLKSVDEAGFNLSQLSLGFAFAFAGLANRKRPWVHKRLMLFGTLMLTVAAADRVALVLQLDEVRVFRKLLAVAPGLALVAFDAWFKRTALLLSVSSLVVTWLLLWYTVSGLVFLRPAGEAVMRALSKILVW